MKTSGQPTLQVGKKNNTFQHLEVIKTNRHKRFFYKEFFVEGFKNIKSALANGWKIKNWVFSDFSNLSDWAKSILVEFPSEKNFCLSGDLMKELSGKNDTSEIIGVFHMQTKQIKNSKNPFVVICDRPSKKGNLGSVIRSAHAFGCDGVIVTGHSVDIFDPEVINASMGSFFEIPVEKIDTNEQLVEKIQKVKSNFPTLQVVGTAASGEVELTDCDFSIPTVIVIGNEGSGLSKFYVESCNKLVRIPMKNGASSFNAACAATVFMYEVSRQRSKV